ncbi:MAG: glycosyl hydrolase family 25 [Crocinitomicaceae bacterium]|nr:glycosyl hydrolase family 25 [Crocinitomicaceae bacterium]
MKNLLLLLISCLTLTCQTEPELNTTINTTDGKVIGIDISHHQGNIDWSEVSTWDDQPIQFIYMKATEGATYQDPKYKTYMKEAKEQDIPIGSYHYFRTSSEPREQFENFMKVIDKNEQDLVPMVDVEEIKHWNSKTYHKNLKLFLKLVEDEFGKKPIIYTVNSFYNHHLSNKYDEYEFLIGRYGKNSPNMRDKKQWFAWQFSESGKVKGIPKAVDIDVLNEGVSLKSIQLD